MQQLLKNVAIKIKQSIQQERWAEAYKYCLEVLSVEPENSKFIKLKRKIENEVNKINKKSTLKELDQIKPLFEAKKYKEYLQELRKLKIYTKDTLKLNEEIIKTEKAIADEYEQNAERFFQEQILIVKELETANKYKEASLVYEKLLNTKLHLKNIEKNLIKMRKKWIDYELTINKTLLDSKEFEEIILFYTGLKNIDPNNSKIEHLIKKTKKEYTLSKLNSQKDYIYKKLKNINRLYAKGKYDKILELAETITNIDPTNKKAIKFKIKAGRKLKKKINQEIIEQIQKTYSKNYDLYKLQKQNFIKI